MTSSKSPRKSSLPSVGIREESNNPTTDAKRVAALNFAEAERARSNEAIALLLDLSGDKAAALRWANEQLPATAIRLIDKAELKWGSKREALAQLRALKPYQFAIFASDLGAQSSRGALFLFAAMCGARLILIGDRNGRLIARSGAGALFIEGARLAIELAIGYLIIAPLSWLLTAMLGAALIFRDTARASRNDKRESFNNEQTGLAALYVRATIVPTAPGGGAAVAGGMASHIAGFARGAHALGHRLKFISSGEIATGYEDAVKIIKPSATIGATRALFELWNNLTFTIRALRYVLADAPNEIDFIYQRYSRFNCTGVALSLVTGLPLLLEYNGSEVWIARNWDPVGQRGLLAKFERLNQRAADRVFVVSEAGRRELINNGLDAARITVNPNGVDTDEFHPGLGGDAVRRALGIEDKTVVGFLGTFGPWHGAPVLAEAATQASASAQCHFLFIGDGEQRNATESIIEKSPHPVSATFAGRIAHTKVAAYLDACDILVSPHVASTDGSDFFGSPTKLFEYMAMARPVVASRLGQIANVIADGENGLLVEPGNARELARAIERLAADEAMRARLGASARQTVIDHFTWRHNARRVFDEFKGAVPEK